MQLFVHRNEPNRPHISSDTCDFKELETKSTGSAFFFLAQPASGISVFRVRPSEVLLRRSVCCCFRPFEASAPSFRLAFRCAPQRRR